MTSPELPHAALGDRSLYPDLSARAYLSHAATAPVSLRVKRAVGELLQDYAQNGNLAVFRAIEQRERLRGKLAALLECSAEELAFTPSTTRGISDLALSFPWRPGDRMVVFRGEFPANVTPWLSAAKAFDFSVVRLALEAGDFDPDHLLGPLERELAAGVRLVACSAVQFQTGFRMPLAEISALCHARGALLAVDGIQACGIVPTRVRELGVDYLVSGAHKWMLGMEGAGFFYATPEAARALRPVTAGWLSLEDGVRFLHAGPGQLDYDLPVKGSIQYLEGGSLGAAPFAALEAGLEPILEIGSDAVFEHVGGYLDELQRGVEALGLRHVRSPRSEQRSGILAVEPPPGRSAAGLVEGLRKHGVFTTMPDGYVRFAPHFSNSRTELPHVLEALRDCLNSRQGET